MTKRDRRAIRVSIALGFVSTAIVAAAYLLGGLDRFELITLDYRFLYANSQRQHDSIVCIDIDNRSLELVGRWPWNRDVQAGLIDVLAELGVAAVLVDITWSETETRRFESDRSLDILGDPLSADISTARLRLPDRALAAAIADAGNIYVNYHFPERDLLRCDEFQTAVDALRRGDEAAASAALASIDERRQPAQRHAELRPETQREERRALDQARIVAALETRPATNIAALARLLNDGVDLVEQRYTKCLEAALERRVQKSGLFNAVREAPADAEEGELLRRLALDAIRDADLGGSESLLTQKIVDAIRNVLSYEFSTAAPIAPLEAVRAVAARVEGVTPAYFEVARGAKRAGFAAFEEADVDGVVRRTPLFVHHGGRCMSQMALTIACDLLGVKPDGIRAERGLIVLQPAPRFGLERALQVDERGRVMIPWLPQRDWVRQFDHISAQGIVNVDTLRGAIRDNQVLLWQTLNEILDASSASNVAELRKALRQIEQYHEQLATLRLRGSRDYRDHKQMLPEVAALERETADAILEIARRPAAASNTASGDAASSAPANSAAMEARLALAERCRRANREIEQSVTDSLAALRQRVAGKVCLIGYTATSLADMKPIPTSKSAPGVMAHANLLNGLLNNWTVRFLSPATNTILTLVAGMLATAISACFRPRLAFLLVTFCITSYALSAGALGFYRWNYWIAVTPVIAAIFTPFVLISIYRYVFIDGERRHLATTLGQYTSKEIARQMADNPELCRRAESREVTAMFTDLRGFTTISEKIGAERTQKVLNVCLGRFTEVMLHHEAMVNKFIGDGIFAFWNPVIFPQPDHAVKACDTAIDLLVSLEALRREEKQRGGDEVFDELLLRIGVATGNAVVGPCGSEQKYDYTCIGDSVNLAARLESANKFFGTQILVAGPVLEQVGNRFIFRALGGVRVKGKHNAVPVYELVGRRGSVDETLTRYAADFESAVKQFQRREWRAAMDAFDACMKRRPEDHAALEYYEAAIGYLGRPPVADWTGAIELLEK